MYTKEKNWTVILLCVLLTSILGILVASLIGCDGISGSWKVDVEEKDDGGAKVEVTPIEPEEPEGFVLAMRYLWGPLDKPDNITKYEGKFDYKKHGFVLNHQFFGRYGAFPWYRGDTAIDGGIPQNINYEKHFRKMEEGYKMIMPETDATCYGVIDFESWAPTWDYHIKAIYKEKSIEKVLSDNPELSPEDPQVEQIARREFTTAAIEVLTRTIIKAKELRPNVKWGYYGFPQRCYYKGDGGAGYNPKLKIANDEMKILYDASQIIIPSLYLFQNYASTTDAKFEFNKKWQREHMEEAVRVSQGKPIFCYVWYGYTPSCSPLLSEKDYELTLRSIINGGADGMLLWMHSYSDDELTRIGNFYKNIGGAVHQRLDLQ